jgi:DNA mismatch repair protein MutL
MKIKVLEAKVISQIAAGEVVERPASVVKELLENALDAESTQISVEIKGGGISLIRVTDNGKGIPANETDLAFERHATSKIESLQDLQSLNSLGFRGEALPSIAAVAQVQMVTSARGETSGTYLSLEGGRIVKHEPRARSPGTTVSVDNLFRKIPARLKFMKSEQAESSRIADVVSRYALAYPEVRFTLVVEGKTSLRTPGSGKLIDGLMAVYGLEMAQNMLEVKSQEEKWESEKSAILVSGLVGSPRIARTSRDYLSLFVNRRWVTSRLLSFCVEEAYHGLLMQGKHPIAVLNITLPPQIIDVNVHPAKTEIKFQDERAVFSALQKAVRQTLVQSAPVPRIEETKSRFGIPASLFTVPSTPFIVPPSAPAFRKTETAARPVSPEAPVTPLVSLPLLRVLGQLARNYIVAEGPDGLFLIDQHAAHERIIFEKIKNQRSARKVEVQGLLEPATFEVEPKQSTLLSSHLAELAEIGFSIEAFGERTYLVRAVPAILRDKDWSGMLKEALATLSGDWAENLAVTLACHSAIRAGQMLSDSEMREMIKQLEQTALPNSCPHGRPTMIQLTIQRLEKEFGRS